MFSKCLLHVPQKSLVNTDTKEADTGVKSVCIIEASVFMPTMVQLHFKKGCQNFSAEKCMTVNVL